MSKSGNCVKSAGFARQECADTACENPNKIYVFTVSLKDHLLKS